MSIRCVGFIRSPDHPHIWTRCEHRATSGDRLCPRHRDALDGAILGLTQWEQRPSGAAKENEATAKNKNTAATNADDTREARDIAEKSFVCKRCGAPFAWQIPAATRSGASEIAVEPTRRPVCPCFGERLPATEGT